MALPVSNKNLNSHSIASLSIAIEKHYCPLVESEKKMTKLHSAILSSCLESKRRHLVNICVDCISWLVLVTLKSGCGESLLSPEVNDFHHHESSSLLVKILIYSLRYILSFYVLTLIYKMHSCISTICCPIDDERL